MTLQVILVGGAKHGVGTTTTATMLALGLAKGAPTLLVDTGDGDVATILGVARPVDTWPHHGAVIVSFRLNICEWSMTEVVGHLDAENIDLMDALGGYEFVVVDIGTNTALGARLDHPQQFTVCDSSYLCAKRALAIATGKPAIDTQWILIEDTTRALRQRDLEAVIGESFALVLTSDPAVARTVDAGLLASRLPDSFVSRSRSLLTHLTHTHMEES